MDSTNIKKTKNMYMISIALCLIAFLFLIYETYSWLNNRRELDTLTWIKTPVMLNIGSGNNHAIAYLDMGEIDAENTECYKEFVFCVYGEPVDIYSLQLAYTTNIAFYYEIYRAELSDEENGNVPFTYNDDNGEHSEYYKYDNSSTPVISAKPLGELTDEEKSKHQSHKLSYGDDEGLNPVSQDKVQSNAEPLYWLASEKGLNILNPINKGNKITGEAYFCDYYVIKVHWDEGTVVNDKETDMVYLTASR